ncbi:MAG TPA: DUF4350 domain-containing protein [Candidatus Eisenbacteria bacterium]|nr:DUF4350 domain-containing protein [Candidatus Eisenbacteria bacterium]
MIRGRLAPLIALALLAAPVSARAAIDPTTGREPVAAPTRELPQNAGAPFFVLWDLTHGVYNFYQPSQDYSDLVTLLASNGFNVNTTTQGIDHVNLTGYSVIVIGLGSAYDSGYTPAEVATIQSFIAAGGGVLVMGDNPGTWNDHINPITQAYGTTCGVASVAPFPTATTSFISHPVFTAVSGIYLAAPGEVDGVAPSVEAAFRDGPAAVVTVHQSCGLVVVGDINFATNPYLLVEDNETFAVNIFRWLAGGCPTPAVRSTWGEVKTLYR